MVPVTSLWIPIVVSAVLVFLVSSIIHMVLPYHRKDFRKLPSEDEIMEALRKFKVPPGDYMMPCGEGPGAMKDPKFLEKFAQGPVLVMTVMKGGQVNMGPQLLQWFIYGIVIAVFAAYIAGRALGPGASYLQVFRFAGATTFIAYALGLWQDSIWYQRSWGTTLKNTFDALVYGLLTAGVFGWLWPR
jgi:hypothetical protein